MNANDWKVLTALSQRWYPMGVTALARRTKLSRSTVRRRLETLSERGHVSNGAGLWWGTHRGARP